MPLFAGLSLLYVLLYKAGIPEISEACHGITKLLPSSPLKDAVVSACIIHSPSALVLCP